MMIGYPRCLNDSGHGIPCSHLSLMTCSTIRVGAENCMSVFIIESGKVAYLPLTSMHDRHHGRAIFAECFAAYDLTY